MFNNKYGDEGFTILFNQEIAKNHIKLDFLGDLKEVEAYIKLCLNFINPFTYYYINESLSEILVVLNNIEKDYTLNIEDNYQVKSIFEIEKRINELELKLKEYQRVEIISNKLSSLAELIYVKCLKLERTYYKLKEVKRYQNYLNRVNDYFFLLKDFLNKEM